MCMVIIPRILLWCCSSSRLPSGGGFVLRIDHLSSQNMSGRRNVKGYDALILCGCFGYHCDPRCEVAIYYTIHG